MESLPNAPDGFTVTNRAPEDLNEVVVLVGAVQQKHEGVASATESFWGVLMADPEVDPERDLLQIRTADTGQLVGFGRYSNYPPHVESGTQGFVHPDHEGVGLGTYIVTWGIDRSKQLVDKAPTDAQVTTVGGVVASNVAARELFEANGYSVSRYFLEMERALDTPVEVEPMPDGVVVRQMRGVEDIEVIVDPITEAFQDHYGHTPSERESEVEQWHRWRGTEEWDDSLVWIVEADGVPIAVNVAITALGARLDTGYIASLGVIRAWRGKGIARALLTTSFAEFQRRGRRIVALHVDADSLTGATKLYESVGMHESERTLEFTRQIRSGTDVVVR
jgi:GNAT superfamily N-acetyltransferase